MSECSNYCSIKNTTHQATQHCNAVLQIVDGVVFRYCHRTPRVNYREVAKLELELLKDGQALESRALCSRGRCSATELWSQLCSLYLFIVKIVRQSPGYTVWP